MKSRIKKLFEAAGGTVEICDVTRDEIWTYSDNLDPQLYAEMIINVCMTICEDIGTSGDGQVCVDAIRKHFK